MIGITLNWDSRYDKTKGLSIVKSEVGCLLELKMLLSWNNGS